MFIEWLWILAGGAYTTGKFTSGIFKKAEMDAKEKQMGYNWKRELELFDLFIKDKKKFNDLVGYEVKTMNSADSAGAFEYAAREIAIKEGWTYPGKRQCFDPDFMIWKGASKESIARERKHRSEVYYNSKRQKELEQMASSDDPRVIEDFKLHYIHRNYNSKDPVSVKVAVIEMAMREGWLYGY